MIKTFYLSSKIDKRASIKEGGPLKIAGYANTTDKDRAGDIIEASAWANGIENFRKNAILLYQHDHGAQH